MEGIAANIFQNPKIRCKNTVIRALHRTFEPKVLPVPYDFVNPLEA